MSAPIENNTAIITNQFDIDECPKEGYTYIYIYSHDNIIIYVGQTTQSIQSRYSQHHRGDLGDVSGGHYANQIHCFQILTKYANYAEGYLGTKLEGISQGCFPNHIKCKDDVPKDIKSQIQRIGRKLQDYKKGVSLKTDIHLFTFNIKGDGNYDTLNFFSKLTKQNDVLIENYFQDKKGLYNYDLKLNELHIADSKIPVYLTYAPEVGYRPMCFVAIKTASDIKNCKEFIKRKTNFPIYFVISDFYYNKYKKAINNIIKKSQIGILLDSKDNLLLQKKFTKTYGKKDFGSDELNSFYTKTVYKAYKTPKGCFKCK